MCKIFHYLYVLPVLFFLFNAVLYLSTDDLLLIVMRLGFCLREAARKDFFIVARQLKPYTPPPSNLELSGHLNFFFLSQNKFNKKVLFCSGPATKALPPPPLELGNHGPWELFLFYLYLKISFKKNVLSS